MANIFANFILIFWPFFALAIVKKRPVDSAAALLLLLPFLFLPVKVSIDFPSLPPLNKESVSSITAFLILYFKFKGFKLLPARGPAKYLLILMLLRPIGTWLTNTDPVLYGSKFIPGLTFNDVISSIVNAFSTIYVPYMVGYNYLNNQNSQKKLLVVLIALGFVYSLLALWEIRFSPQLHRQIYGFFPHSDWKQQLRQGGYRPVVFLGHGLLVAAFFSHVLIAALAHWKSKQKPWRKYSVIIIAYLAGLIVLCKSLSSIIYGFISLILFCLGSIKRCLQVSLVIAVVVGTYPILRSVNAIPIDPILQLVREHSTERGGSLTFRIANEEILLEKANQRPVFGWGGWGRPRVYDTETGKDISVTDGAWIIVYGAGGWAFYLVVFGLLVHPVLQVYKSALERRAKGIDWYIVGLTLMLATNLMDLIPNSSQSPITFLIAGSLIGRIHLFNSTQFKKKNI